MCERDICIGFAQWMKLIHPAILYTHVANERKGLKAGALCKAMGQTAGWPDYMIVSPSGASKSLSAGMYKMLALEVKSDKGRLSDRQKDVRDRMPKYCKFVVAYGLDECIDAVNLYINGST